MITSNFFPEPAGIGPYATDLSEILSEIGYSVRVLTTYPHYPWWSFVDFSYEADEQFEKAKGVQVVRTNMRLPKYPTALQRFLFEISQFFNYVKIMPQKSENFDLVISIIPSVAAGYAGRLASRKFNAPLFLVVQDLSGVGVSQSGISNGKITNQLAVRVEKNLLRAARKVSCISVDMSAYLKCVFLLEQITLIPNYRFRALPILDKKLARKKLGLPEDKFLIIHTGNMGMKQGLHNLFPIARDLEKNSNILFYLVGHGNQEDNLAKMAQNFQNIFVLPAVDDEKYSDLLNSADVLLVCELKTQKTMSLPSKIISYSSANRPILALVAKDGATAKFLENTCLRFDPDDKFAIIEAIEKLSVDDDFYGTQLNKSRLLGDKILDRETVKTLYTKWVNLH